MDADEEGVGGDDAADALRYLVATKPREVRVRKLRELMTKAGGQRAKGWGESGIGCIIRLAKSCNTF